MLSLPSNSVLALRISVMGDGEGRGGVEGANGIGWGIPPRSVGGAWIPEGCEEGISRRSRFHRPVPGILTFRYTPRGPTFTLNGAAPTVALSPCRVRFSLMPGSTLNVLRNRQLMRIS